MKEIALNDLIDKALTFKRGEWHFHVLTPQCVFNDTKNYKIILECPEGNYYSLADTFPSQDLQSMEHHFYRA